MSELKCPCCGWVLAFQKSRHPVVPDKYQCEQVSCWFGCNAEDLPRIAAAMELAYRYVESSGPHAEERQAHIAMKDHPDYLKLAQDRVLEVFK